NVRHLPYEGDVLSSVPEQTSIILLSAQGGDHRALIVAQELKAHSVTKPMVMAAPRGLSSTLSEAERSGLFATMTLPLRRSRVRQVIAGFMGRASLGDRRAAAGAKFEPPALDVARAAHALILVAEDNATNQVVIKRMLSQLGYAHEVVS